MWTYGLAFAVVSASASASAIKTDTADKDGRCFDLAVIATNPTYRWHPVDAGPDEIVIRTPVSIRFAVEQVFAGAISYRHVDVGASLHTQFNPAIKRFLLFLKKESNGKYSLQQMNHELVRERSGQLVWPIAAPLDPSYTASGFIPSDYEALMRPIRYNSRDAWWLVTPSDVDPPSADEYRWGRLDNDRIITASRGISATDLVAAAAKKRC